MRRLQRWALLFLVLTGVWLGSSAHVHAAPDLETLLRWQDAQVLRRYQETFVTEKRYNALLERVGERLNTHIAQVYPRFKPVRYYVFVGNMGFNAQTWHSIIIFDSLLLDTMRKLAEGVAAYGTTDCPYVHALAIQVARLEQQRQSGRSLLRVGSADNPYRLPTLWGLTPAQREDADRIFEEMLAAWMAHEGSHAFLEHTRERVEAQQLAQLYSLQGEAPPEAVRQYIGRYLSSETTLQKEREADAYGIRLTLRAGYGVDGLIRSFEFAQLLEQLTGQALQPVRTHPTPSERIVMARQIAGSATPKP